VPGVAGRFDHFTDDAKREELIVSANGNDSAEIINMFTRRVVHSIKGLDEPQDVVYVPGFDKIFVANAGDRSVKIFDGKTNALRRTIDLGDDPDDIRWDEPSKRVFVGYGKDGTGAIAMFDPATDAHVGNDLKTAGGGHPESFQLEKKGSRIFVNVPDDGNVVEVLDRKGGPVTKWQLNGAKKNNAMALNEADHRLYISSRIPPLLIVFDTETGKEVARLPAAADCDDIFFDAERKRIYYIAGQGFICVYQENDLDHYELMGKIPTRVGARTGFFNIFYSEGNLSVGVPPEGNEPAEIWTYEAVD